MKKASNIRRHAMAALLFAASLSGCSTPQPLSFVQEQLGAEDSTREGAGDQHYRTNIAIHGLGTPKTVGAVVTVPNKNSFKEFFDSIFGKQKLPDLLATPVSDNPSRIIEQVYAPEEGFDLKNYMAEMDKLISIYAELGTLQGKLLLLQTGEAYATDATPKPSNADKVAAQLQDAFGMAGFTKADIAGQKTALATKIINKNNEVVGQQSILQERGNKKNVWVWRWTMDAQSSLNGSIGSTASLSASNKENRSGYLVISGLRISTLELGSDFKDWLEKQNGSGLAIPGKPYLVIQQLGAKQLAFREDSEIEKALVAGASFNISDLGSNFASNLKQQQIQLGLALHHALLTGTRGISERTDMKPVPFSFTSTSGSQNKEIESAKAYAPYYTVRIEIDSLKKALGQK